MENNAPFQSFLRMVAEDLYKDYGNDLSKVTVVFPNYRSRLFFNNQLAEISDQPIWSPRYTSIKDLFLSHSQEQIADPMKLICILHSIYNQYVERKESFDEFYFWGEILLSDFDDVDKNLVNAQMLFSNIRDMGEQIDTFEHLSDEQKEYLTRFFQNFSPEKSSQLKEHFIQLWDSLINVYSHFKEKLREEGLAYEGMLYRDVIEQATKGDAAEGFDAPKYAFVGFNVLNECETALFKLLDRAGKAIFYWDYDTFYTDNNKNEAGRFINKNKEMFPNKLPKSLFEEFSLKGKEITLVSASTENAQARYLNRYLQEAKKSYKDSDIAVVLCNEGLLLPVLHSIPDCIKDTNVTMGFPLTQTPIYSLVINLLDMQSEMQLGKKESYRYKVIAPLLRHPYVRTTIPQADELIKKLTQNRIFYPSKEILSDPPELSLLFKWAETPDSLMEWLLDIVRFIASYHGEKQESQDPLYEDLYKEAVFRLFTQLNRLRTVITEEEMEMTTHTLIRLIKRLLSSITIPFKGEPVKGMQIMGFLETRNLDFKNVVLLSVNEGKLPNSGKESSFIPHSLRKGYGMTTIDHKNSLYAYYFYRLLQRAEKVTMLYNTATEGANRGQMSRFMLQLMVEKSDNIHINMLDIRSDLPIAKPDTIQIEKTEEDIKLLKARFDSSQNGQNILSPSAINCYVDCSLRFYFKYVLRLKAEEELTEEVDSSTFGSIFHKAAELFYKKHLNKVLSKEFLEKEALNQKMLEALVDEAFQTEYFNLDPSKKIEYTGKQLLYRKVEIDLLRKLLKADAEYAPFSIYELEKEHYETISIDTSDGKVVLKVGGIVDRIDLKEGILRTVDYKTSGKATKAATLESIFEQGEDRERYLVQVLLYAMVLAKENPQYVVRPSLLFVTKQIDNEANVLIVRESEMAGKKNASSPVENINDYAAEYRELLTATIAKIFDKEEPFRQTIFEESCAYCDFKNICRKRS